MEQPDIFAQIASYLDPLMTVVRFGVAAIVARIVYAILGKLDDNLRMGISLMMFLIVGIHSLVQIGVYYTALPCLVFCMFLDAKEKVAQEVNSSSTGDTATTDT